MQHQNTFIMIADLHAMTTSMNLYSNTLKTAKLLIASGLDPSKSTIFQQSMVPAHSQLYWVLSNFCSVGELERMAQWKVKSKERHNHSGLLTYPILQAADILLYNPNFVPVGEDQKQHLELSRSLVRKLNRDIKKISKSGIELTIPKSIISSSSKVMSLRSPEQKMSKSDPNENSCILLTDSRAIVASKINKAVTDSIPTLDNLNNRPGMLNLCQIMAGCQDKSIDHLVSELSNLQGPTLQKLLKEETATVLSDTIEPILQRFNALTNKDVEDILQQGSEKANAVAQDTLESIYKGLKVWK